MRRILRFLAGIVLPAVLIFAGILFLVGCIYIPVAVRSTNYAAKVGDADSGRPVRVGLATREQVIALFGPPRYSDDSGRRIGYAWSVKDGFRLSFCFAVTDQVADRGIELDFDEHDVLYRFKVAEGAAFDAALQLRHGAVLSQHMSR